MAHTLRTVAKNQKKKKIKKGDFWYIKKSDRRRLRRFFIAANVSFVLLLFVEFFFPGNPFLRAVELLFGLLFVIEIGFLYIVSRITDRRFWNWLLLIDVISLFAIFLRFVVADIAFLHILSAARILRSYRTLDDFFEVTKYARHKSLIVSLVNLLVFTFVSTSVVFALQQGRNPEINTYVDAFYFTVSTLTTTGFGDITVVGQDGRILSTIIMLFGVGIFFKIATNIFRPRKVYHKCKHCGLLYHDLDASHCKHCGQVVHINNEGE